MKLIAKHTVNLGGGNSAAPGAEFEIADKAEAEELIRLGAARKADDAEAGPAKG